MRNSFRGFTVVRRSKGTKAHLLKPGLEDVTLCGYVLASSSLDQEPFDPINDCKLCAHNTKVESRATAWHHS